MPKRIIISVSSDLATDQRVQKVAKSCFENGYDVLLLGRKLRNSPSVSFVYSYKRFQLLFNHSFLFYAELNFRLFLFLLFSKSDILISNDTDTLIANYLASVIRKKKLIFDAHELFPEVPELVNRKFVKKFWTKIEDIIFPKLRYSYTVCQSIADYYNSKYRINMEVIRNVPYLQKNDNQKDNKEIKTIIYQGALNIGRGLEWIIQAIPFINNVQLIIIGEGDISDKLKQQVKSLNLSDRVIFKGKINPENLKSFTASADLGLCLLENKGLSYYYSLPNRIFDYIHAEIPVLATDFPEIRNIVEKNKIGILINHYEPEYLAEAINKILLEEFDTSHFSDLAKELCWENEEKKLMEIIHNS
ncbi:Glycosyl transferase group 1 [uncultured Paludibacter sp.]|nr:Glycosyl transferase group 1 [uncultured Paludibacter sp.]